MNERIHQLAEQASETINYRIDPLTFKHVDDHTGPYSRVEFNREKFAELIVQECARVASRFSIDNKRIHPDIDPRNMPEANRMVYHATCQSVAEEIRAHFGDSNE